VFFDSNYGKWSISSETLALQSANIDDDIAARSVDYLKRQKAGGKPVFL